MNMNPGGTEFHLVHMLLTSLFNNKLGWCRARVLPSVVLLQTNDWRGPGSPVRPAFTLSLEPIALILPSPCYQGKVRPYLSPAWFPQQKGLRQREAEWNGSSGGMIDICWNRTAAATSYISPLFSREIKLERQIVYDKASNQTWQPNSIIIVIFFLFRILDV